MAVSKRVRYEVLRRDNHTCRYCGAKAPDVTLHVDHVIPVALGGSDKPDNLVAACKDCNLGKTSTQATDTIVAEVDEKALQVGALFRQAMEDASRQVDEDRYWCDEIEDWWNDAAAKHGQSFARLETGWEGTIAYWRRLGVPANVITDAIDKAMSRPGVQQRGRFKYFCGIVWSIIRDASDKATGGLPKATIRRCEHCLSCVYGDAEDECDVFREYEHDEDPYRCSLCGRQDCYYDLGIQDGMQHEWQENADAILHYRTCPEVNRGA